MRQLQSIVLILAATALVAACGSSAATTGPGGATTAPGGGGGGGATTAPGGRTTAPVGGGAGSKPAGWDKFGKVSFKVSGPLTANGELGFAPANSVFGGSNTTSLSFYTESTNEILVINVLAGKATLSYGSPNLTLPGAECQSSNLKVDSSGASGSLKCDAAVAFNVNGTTFTDVKVEAEFTAKP